MFRHLIRTPRIPCRAVPIRPPDQLPAIHFNTQPASLSTFPFDEYELDQAFFSFLIGLHVLHVRSCRVFGFQRVEWGPCCVERVA